MATSSHIFETLDEFKRIYGDKFDLLEYNIPLRDLWIKDGKLWIVTNTNDQKQQPELFRSLVHFRNGSIDEYRTGGEKLVLHGKMRINFKKGKLEFFPRFLRKPLLSLRYGRFYGDVKDKKRKIDYNQRFYDFHNDRMIFILEEKNG